MFKIKYQFTKKKIEINKQNNKKHIAFTNYIN